MIDATVDSTERLVFLSDDAMFIQGLSYCTGYFGIDCGQIKKVGLDDFRLLLEHSGTLRYVLCIRDRALFWPVWKLVRSTRQPYLILIHARSYPSPGALVRPGIILPKRLKAERLFSCLRQFSARRQDYHLDCTPHAEYIIRQLCQGKSVYAIGKELGISRKTVQSHKYKYLKKYQLHYYNALGVLWLGDLLKSV